MSSRNSLTALFFCLMYSLISYSFLSQIILFLSTISNSGIWSFVKYGFFGSSSGIFSLSLFSLWNEKLISEKKDLSLIDLSFCFIEFFFQPI